MRVSFTLTPTPTPTPTRQEDLGHARRVEGVAQLARHRGGHVGVRAAVDQQGGQLDGLHARRGEQRCTPGSARHARREYDGEAEGGQGVGLGGERHSLSQPSPWRRLDGSLPRIMSRGEGAAWRAAIRSA